MPVNILDEIVGMQRMLAKPLHFLTVERTPKITPHTYVTTYVTIPMFPLWYSSIVSKLNTLRFVSALILDAYAAMSISARSYFVKYKTHPCANILHGLNAIIMTGQR